MNAGHPDFYKMTEEENRLYSEKNKDYCSNTDPLANFKRVSAIMALYPSMNWATPEGIAIVYSWKQMDACVSLLEKGTEGEVETVDTRARDVHVY
uniref:Uncharacterized protein n=1 Tax=viral metagenome TaxID=1070528 RepID=A0A6M3JS45_9ZZZZ